MNTALHANVLRMRRFASGEAQKARKLTLDRIAIQMPGAALVAMDPVSYPYRRSRGTL